VTGGATRGLAGLLARLVGRRAAHSPAPPFAWIDVPTLAARLRAGDGTVVIDVRGADEFAGPLGHVAGARNLPVDELARRLAELGPLAGRPIVLVCKTQMRSAAAAAALTDAGFRDLAVLRGGMVEWNRQGLPVERASET
jgi:rhodanese-related sulfurtransferase